MILKSISLEDAIQIIHNVCDERFNPLLKDAKWFICSLDADEFQNLLVYYNTPQDGKPVGWQKLTPNNSSRISDVANALYEYTGGEQDLIDSKKKVTDYEKKIDFVGYYRMFCLCRVGSSGRITLFETNKRALALYWHYFLFHKREFPMISGVLGEVDSKRVFQSE
jgi:hypothetical protein